MAKQEPKERIFTKQELICLIVKSEAPLRHIILVVLNICMRKIETLNLEKDFIRIEAKRSKNLKIRVIPVNNSIGEMFYKLQYSWNRNQHFFDNPKTERAFVFINRRRRSLLKELGIKSFRFHYLRHNFATYVHLRKGGDLVSLQPHGIIPTFRQLPGEDLI